jgi:hypothetical protein
MKTSKNCAFGHGLSGKLLKIAINSEGGENRSKRGKELIAEKE